MIPDRFKTRPVYFFGNPNSYTQVTPQQMRVDIGRRADAVGLGQGLGTRGRLDAALSSDDSFTKTMWPKMDAYLKALVDPVRADLDMARSTTYWDSSGKLHLRMVINESGTRMPDLNQTLSVVARCGSARTFNLVVPPGGGTLDLTLPDARPEDLQGIRVGFKVSDEKMLSDSSEYRARSINLPARDGRQHQVSVSGPNLVRVG
jgi:hypothetical protein